MRPFWRRRLLVPALGLLALNGVAYAAYTRPRTIRERDIAERAVVLREEVARERSRLEGIRLRARTIDQNAADVGRFYKALGQKESLLQIQEDIVGIGRQLGLTLGSRTYRKSGVKGSESLARFQITMPITGSYRQVASFLQRIEALPHFVTVDSIALREDGAVSGATNLNVGLSVFFVDAEPDDGD